MFFNTYVELQAFHYVIIFLLTLFAVSTVNQNSLFERKNEGLNGAILLYAIFLILAIGLRRTDGGGFGDTTTYVFFFDLYASQPYFNEFEGEWLWNYLMYLFAKFGSVSVFLTFVSTMYITFHIISCYRLLKGRTDLLIIACFSSFSFLSYGVNGIRNGLACSLIILAISFVLDYKSKTDIIIAGILSFCAYNIHHSTALPIVAMLFCHYYKNTKNLIYLWFLSIPISLVAGGQVESFFSGLGFDDRMTAYSQGHNDDFMFSHTGFRWDFLLYSFMPILLGYYITFKQFIQDEKYSYLLNMYIVCNAFWVMMIRASYSNRFAYLSWFLYPIVLLYPLLSFPVFNQDSDKKVKYILFAHMIFTFFMWTIGK